MNELRNLLQARFLEYHSSEMHFPCFNGVSTFRLYIKSDSICYCISNDENEHETGYTSYGLEVAMIDQNEIREPQEITRIEHKLSQIRVYSNSYEMNERGQSITRDCALLFLFTNNQIISVQVEDSIACTLWVGHEETDINLWLKSAKLRCVIE